MARALIQVYGRFEGVLHLEEGDTELCVFAKQEGGKFEPDYQM